MIDEAQLQITSLTGAAGSKLVDHRFDAALKLLPVSKGGEALHKHLSSCFDA